MTAVSTEMIAAIFYLATLFKAGILANTYSVQGTGNISFILATVTGLMDSAVTRLTVCSVTVLFTCVQPTVKNFLTGVLTGKFITTFNSRCFLVARTCEEDGGHAGRTRSCMAYVYTSVYTSFFTASSTHLPA